MTSRTAAPLLAAMIVACTATDDATEPRVDRASSAVIAGSPSGDGDNANVLITRGIEGSTGQHHCSGRLITPRLVLTARHCFLRNTAQSPECAADGTPLSFDDDPSLVRPDAVTVGVGSNRTALQSFDVANIITVLDVTPCRHDLAFLVLTKEALATRTPFRRAPVRIGDTLTFSGWGYTADGQSALPQYRSTRSDLRVVDVGPGLIPAGSFAIGGHTLCNGDSGGVALLDGAVVGVHSRLGGASCEAEDSKNILTGTAIESDLITRAFVAVGETPWYDDTAPPRSASDAGPASASNDADDASGCELTRSPRGSSPSAIAATAALVVIALRRRRASTI